MGSRESRAEADAAFRDFVTTHETSLLRLALVLTTNRSAAEDLVQTALMRTYSRWGRLRAQDPLAYTRRTLTNANIDRWRRDRGREVLTDLIPEQSRPDDSDGYGQRDLLLRALSELTDRERRVVALRFLLDLSEAETADELRLPLGTVKSVTHRAIGKLRASGHLADYLHAEES